MDFDKKHPLQTIDKINCLTKCHEKGKPYVNPITLDKVLNLNDSSCAIIPVPQSNGDYKTRGICKVEDNEIYRVPVERDSMLLTFYFDPYDFLSQIYGLTTFTEVITWTTDNYYYHFETIKRVHNAAWKAFGSNIENISDAVIDFYYNIITNNWIKDYKDNILLKYSFDVLSESLKNSSEENIDLIIVSNFINKNFFVQIIKKYISTYRDTWLNIDSHYRNLKKFVYKCILKNMKYKLNKKHDNNNDVDLSKK